jgi:hypothetical protein
VQESADGMESIITVSFHSDSPENYHHGEANSYSDSSSRDDHPLTLGVRKTIEGVWASYEYIEASWFSDIERFSTAICFSVAILCSSSASFPYACKPYWLPSKQVTCTNEYSIPLVKIDWRPLRLHVASSADH